MLCLSCVLTLALAACGASTTPGSGDQVGRAAGATATAGSGNGSGGGNGGTGGNGGSGGSGSPTATPHSGGGGSPSGGGTPGSSGPPYFFTVTATAGNSSGDYTIIDNVVSNGFSSLALFVTANWNPNGSGGVYDDHALGVFYLGSPVNKWAIYHEDRSPYILNASYNVWVRSTTQPGTFIWKATSSNSAGDYTIIDHAGANGNPNAVLLVTHNWNPGGGTGAGIYDNHALGVYYISSLNKWAVYHQDRTAYTPGASYNVYVTNPDGTRKFVQHACAASSTCAGDYITINSSASNGKSNAIVFVTANWNPGGSGGVYDNHHLGVFYTSTYHQWAVYHQDKAAYIPNTSYNIVIPQPGD